MKTNLADDTQLDGQDHGHEAEENHDDDTTQYPQQKRKAGAKPKAKAGKAKAGAKPKARPGAKPKAKAGAKPKARPGAKPKAKAGAKPKGKAGAKPKGKAGARSKATKDSASGDRKSKAERDQETKEPKSKADRKRKSRAADVKPEFDQADFDYLLEWAYSLESYGDISALKQEIKSWAPASTTCGYDMYLARSPAGCGVYLRADENNKKQSLGHFSVSPTEEGMVLSVGCAIVLETC